MAVLQQTPQGAVAIVVTEADKDSAQLLGAIASSNDPFDVWFRQQVLALHGLELSHRPDRRRPSAYTRLFRAYCPTEANDSRTRGG